jgi:hypothetical protein
LSPNKTFEYPLVRAAPELTGELNKLFTESKVVPGAISPNVTYVKGVLLPLPTWNTPAPVDWMTPTVTCVMAPVVSVSFFFRVFRRKKIYFFPSPQLTPPLLLFYLPVTKSSLKNISVALVPLPVPLIVNTWGGPVV